MIHPADVLFHVGGRTMARYGALTRRVLPLTRRGGDVVETVTRADPGYFIDHSGVLRSVAAATPRVQWLDLDADDVFETPVLLVEHGVTNVFTQSEALDHTDWTKDNVTVSADADAAPDGTTTADRIVEDAAASTDHQVRQAPTLTADASYVIGAYLKAGTRDWTYLLLSETASFANRVIQWFDLATGVAGSSEVNGTGSLTGAGIVPLANGWYWCWLSGGVGNAATGIDGVMGIATGDTVRVYSGDGSSYISAWRPQLVDDHDLPSHGVPTTTASVARATDVITIPITFRPAIGSFTIKLRLWAPWTNVATIVAAANVLQLGEGAASTLRLRRATGSTFEVLLDGPTAQETVTRGFTTGTGTLECLVQVQGLPDAGQVRVWTAANGWSAWTTALTESLSSWATETLRLGSWSTGGKALDGGLALAVGVRGLHENTDFAEFDD